MPLSRKRESVAFRARCGGLSPLCADGEDSSTHQHARPRSRFQDGRGRSCGSGAALDFAGDLRPRIQDRDGFRLLSRSRCFSAASALWAAVESVLENAADRVAFERSIGTRLETRQRPRSRSDTESFSIDRWTLPVTTTPRPAIARACALSRDTCRLS